MGLTKGAQALGLACLVILSALLYAPSLGYMPAHLGWDEVFFGLNAHSIATTGKDINGRVLPLYFQMGIGNIWYQPAIVYTTALLFTVLPVTEATLRLPTVLVALLDIFLMYFVARRILKSDGLGFVAAGLLALTPAHFLLGRVALDYLFPLPFILTWLLCLSAFVDRPRPWLIAAATAALGVGFFSYMASVVMMPFYFATTLLLVMVTPGARPRWRYAAAALMFFLPLLILVPWLRAHPSAYADQVARYRVYDVHRFTPLQGVKEFLNYQNLTHRVSMYWGYLGPNYLFMSGAIKMSMTTRKVGVFLMACGVFLPVGIYQMLTTRRDWLGRLLVFGFATAPLAALLVDDPFAVDREMNLLPFAILLTAFGVGCLLRSPSWRVRALAVCLLVLVPVEFSSFYRDYFGEYRLASAEWFNRNIRGGLEDIIAREDRGRPIPLFLNTDIGDVDHYWRFYLIKHDRGDLLPRTVYFDPKTIVLQTIPAGSLVVCPTEDLWQQEHVKQGELKILKVIHEPDDRPSFVVLERL